MKRLERIIKENLRLESETEGKKITLEDLKISLIADLISIAVTITIGTLCLVYGKGKSILGCFMIIGAIIYAVLIFIYRVLTIRMLTQEQIKTDKASGGERSSLSLQKNKKGR